jgi:nucleoside-diphosphate-sugar epimerase
MNILLTGARGFTGRHFQTAAQSEGHRVQALACDINDATAVCEAVARIQPDAVVHLAAISFVGHGDASALYATNVVGTMNLLQALVDARSKPSSVLLASSANVYGNCQVSPIVETQVHAPVNHYAMSKSAMEHMAISHYGNRLPLTIARPFNYTGPGQAEQFLIPKLVSHFVRRAPSIELGNLDVAREFNDVRMVCEGYLRLMQADGVSGEVFNVCSGRVHALRDVLALLEEMTGHALQVNVNPSLVRATEVRRLCGSPDKLREAVGELPRFELTETLSWMLEGVSS